MINPYKYRLININAAINRQFCNFDSSMKDVKFINKNGGLDMTDTS